MGRYEEKKCFGRDDIFDNENKEFMQPSETADILNAYDALLKRQEECEHRQQFYSCTGKVQSFTEPYYSNYCPDCGADLRRKESK